MNVSWKVMLLVIGVSTLTLRALLDSRFATTTLVYIAVPFMISLALAFLTKNSEGRSIGARYLNHLRSSTIVFLATSVILFEGFICVVMFMPIYYFFVSVGFAFSALSGRSSDEQSEEDLTNTFKSYALPVIVLMLVTEGLTPITTVDRNASATFVADSDQSVQQLQTNMAKPIAFGQDRHWFLKLFPLPDQVFAGSLKQGDIHKLHFTYKRWVFTNEHQGEMHIKLAKVSPDHIRTQIIRNDSYLANYMRIDGTDVRFNPQPNGKTRVALTIRYERSLDPAWYFGPMQHFAARQSARQFLTEIIMRHPVDEVVEGGAMGHSLQSGSAAFKVNSLTGLDQADPGKGRVVWDPARSLWNMGFLLGALILGPLYFSWGGFLSFLVLSAITLCAGHSVGFHRRLIHRSFECPKWLERVMVYCGTLVGMGGPIWTIGLHDSRDWAQREEECHWFLRHGKPIWIEGFTYLNLKLILDHPPGFDPGDAITKDRFYQFLQATWMLHQIPVALLLYVLGGWSWVVWGVIVRVAACITMHWYISYIAHTRGPQDWHLDDAALQAHNVPLLAIPTMGESWHCNHHAFPRSAAHGLYPGQIDLGFQFIRLLERLGLAWDIKLPSNLPPRPGISPVTDRAMSIAAPGQEEISSGERKG